MFDKLSAVEAQYEKLMTEMADPIVQGDTAKFRAHSKLLADLKLLLVPKDPNDAKNVVLEIRAGAGGDEAALFASDLFRMYSRYAERQGWRVEVLNMSD